MLYSNLKYIFKTYKKLNNKDKIFISLRYITCPWNKLINLVNEEKKILDIGCGHGLFLNLIKKKFNNMICVGQDHDSIKIQLAKLSSTEIKFLTGDEEINESAEYFDYVSLIDVLYSVPLDKWDSILTLAYRNLKPGGTLILKETVNKPLLKYYFCSTQEIIAIKILHYTKGEFPHLMPIEYYLEKLKCNNFKVSKHYSISKKYIWPHYLFIANK